MRRSDAGTIGGTAWLTAPPRQLGQTVFRPSFPVCPRSATRDGQGERTSHDARERRDNRRSGEGRISRGERGDRDLCARGGDRRGDCDQHKCKDDKGHWASRRGYSSCNEGFTWPTVRDDDNGDDYNHPGHGKITIASFWGFDTL
jgi:hypothetical protein